jgi:Lon protease-like protein
MMNAVVGRAAGERLMAMALLREGWEPHYHTRKAPIHPVVCVGRVIQHEELPDGKFNLLLLGLRRATVVVETGERPYRQALLAPAEHDSADFDSERLRKLLHRAVEHVARQSGGLSAESIQRIFDSAPTTDVLVDVLVYHLVSAEPPAFKQSLLEEFHAPARAQKLLRHLREKLGQAPADPAAPWPPPTHLN